MEQQPKLNDLLQLFQQFEGKVIVMTEMIRASREYGISAMRTMLIITSCKIKPETNSLEIACRDAWIFDPKSKCWQPHHRGPVPNISLAPSEDLITINTSGPGNVSIVSTLSDAEYQLLDKYTIADAIEQLTVATAVA